MWQILGPLLATIVFLGIPGASIAWFVVNIVKLVKCKRHYSFYRYERGNLIGSLITSVVILAIVVSIFVTFMSELTNM